MALTGNKYLDRITNVAKRLVNHAYLELSKYKINAVIKCTSAFALVRWSRHETNIRLTLDKQVLKWHDAQLTGLIAHELSHVALGAKSSEESVDRDVIERGLGVYLAIERVMSGRHEDQMIARGVDRYLGYRTIRNHLDERELEQLEKLLVHLRVYPQSKTVALEHDAVIYDCDPETYLTINGHIFTVGLIPPDASVHLIQRNNEICLVVNKNIKSCSSNTNQIRNGLQ